jgi:hypothetical protein
MLDIVVGDILWKNTAFFAQTIETSFIGAMFSQQDGY